MKNITIFLFLISSATLFAQNLSTFLVVKIGQPEFSTPQWQPEGIFDQDISKSFGIGLENVHQSKRQPNIGFSWGFIPTYQKVEEYTEQSYEGDNQNGTTTKYVNTSETQFHYIDLAIPLKMIGKFNGIEISAGLTPVYHASTKIKGHTSHYNLDSPDQIWENETSSHLCHDWISDCSFETVSWDYPLDFWGSVDLGYRFKKYKVAVQYDQNLTKGKLFQGGNDLAFIDVALPFSGFWGNSIFNTQNISLQMSYQLF